MPEELVEIYVDIVIKETQRGSEKHGAILCEIGDQQVWIPKSALDAASDVRLVGDGNGVIVIPEKLAIEKELV